MSEDNVLIVDEPYTCVFCGRKNLKFEEITYRENEEKQIDLATVACKKCGLMNMWATFEKMVKPGHEDEAERLFKTMLDQFEYNYNRRLIRRATKKKG